MEYVFEILLPLPQLREGRKALYGHSYGGNFVLHMHFSTKADVLDVFIAASPTIWLNGKFLETESEPAFHSSRSEQSAENAAKQAEPSLLLSFGSPGQQSLTQRADQLDESFRKKVAVAEDAQLKVEVLALAERLERCRNLSSVSMYELPGEDHGSAAVVRLQRGIMSSCFERHSDLGQSLLVYENIAGIKESVRSYAERTERSTRTTSSVSYTRCKSHCQNKRPNALQNTIPLVCPVLFST